MTPDLVAAFAAEVGGPGAGPVVAVGGRTSWDVGGAVDPGARQVRAPVGIVEHEPAEMTVRVRAGTTVDDLDRALADHGQCVALPGTKGSTVGGALAVGRSGVRRLGWGPVRDTVLEVRYVSAQGSVVKAGGPTVKNVSGYDLCRLLVGSRGTLALLAEVVLRTRPVAPVERWFSGCVDPFGLLHVLHHPVALLWDGTTSWLLLDGHPDDVAAQAALAGLAPLSAGHGPPELPPQRWSLRPGALRSLPGDGQGRFVAEVGVGVVHRDAPAPAPAPPAEVIELHRRLKDGFDPTGRLAPGRSAFP